MSKQSMTIKDILDTEYFWKEKLFHDYPQYNHNNFLNYSERYKRLYQGKTNEYTLKFYDTIDIVFDLNETETEYVTDKNLLLLTKIAVEKFNCIRGDIIVIAELEGNDNIAKVIFDGQKLVNMDFCYDDGIPPNEFKIFTEFPMRYWQVLYPGGYVTTFPLFMVRYVWITEIYESNSS